MGFYLLRDERKPRMTHDEAITVFIACIILVLITMTCISLVVTAVAFFISTLPGGPDND